MQAPLRGTSQAREGRADGGGAADQQPPASWHEGSECGGVKFRKKTKVIG